MGLSVRQKRTFLSIAYGKIKTKDENGVETSYDQFEGTLVRISYRTATFKDSPTPVVDFLFVDNGEEYVISIPRYGNMIGGLLLSLDQIEKPGEGVIKLVTYSSGDYTNIAIYYNGQPVKWGDKRLPKVEEVKLRSGMITKDPTYRNQGIDALLDTLASKLGTTPVAPVNDGTPAPEGADMPDFSEGANYPDPTF